jgi:hypothetical protein
MNIDRQAADAVFLWNGNLFVPQYTPSTFKEINIVAGGAGDQTAWTPAAGKKFRLLGWQLRATVDETLIFKQAAAAIGIRIHVGTAGLVSPNLGSGYVSTAINEALVFNFSAAGTLTGFVFGCEE